MRKRIKTLVFLLTAVLLLQMCPLISGAENIEHLKNGDFEAVTNDAADSWKLPEDASEVYPIDKDVHDGKYAMRIGGGSFITQDIRTTVGGAEYIFKGWMRPVHANALPAIKAEFYDANGYIGDMSFDFTGFKVKEWQEVTHTFTIPEGTVRMYLLIRAYGSHEVVWDDVSMHGPGKAGAASAETTPAVTTKPAETQKTEATVTGEAVEHFKNGDFEAVTDGVADAWKVAPDVETCSPDKREKFAGQYSMRQNSSTGYIMQDIRTVAGGAAYTFTAQAKPSTTKTKPTIKIEYYSASGYMGAFDNEFSGLKLNEWQEVKYEFVLPEGTTRMSFLLRTYGGGTTYWDNASVMGASKDTVKGDSATESPVILQGISLPESELLPMAPDGKELIVNNPGFEDGVESTKGIPNGWNEIFSKLDADGNPYAYVTDEKAHTGKYSFKVSTTTGNMPWVCYLITGLTEGEVLQPSMWVMNQKTGNVCFKYEFYSGDRIAGGEGVAIENGISNSTFYSFVTDDWYHYSDTVQVPKGARTLALYIRAYQATTCYFDDVSCYKVSDAPRAILDTDDVFYYADSEYGTATLDVDERYYADIAAAGTVSFRLLKDGVTVAEKGRTALKDSKATFSYGMHLLTEEKKPYIVEVTLYDGTGAVTEVFTQDIYRYPRPATLGKDGVITKNGVRIENPAYSYGAYNLETTYPDLHKIGVNVVQGSANEKSIAAAEKNDLYILAVLYSADTTSGITPAGHSTRLERTKKLVEMYKDNPRIIGWMVMDEYHYHYPTSNELLKESYMAVRAIDDTNPVFVMESNGTYADTGSYADILGYDPYPQGKEPVATFVADQTKILAEKASYKKPIWCLNQTFTYGNNKNYLPEGAEAGNYYPTAVDARSMIYQALFAGGDAVGHYKFENTKSGVNLNSPGDPEVEAVWNILCKMGEGELSEAFSHFAYREYPIFKEGKSGNTWYSLYVKDNVLKAVVMNQNPTLLGADEAFEIPLTSDDGTIQIGAFTANCVSGGGTTITGNGTLSGTVPKNDVLVFTITPSETVNYSSLKICEFRDLTDYPWAAAQIRSLADANVIEGDTENFYRPGKAITRGDFAMYLIRALGLSAEASDNFADVDASARFAKEIAVGKALGILKGIDGVHYNPYEEISRQDLMVICARGMRLKKALEEGGNMTFTDKDAIADYAVLDIAAMVRANIVAGYEDGTVRPLGNTTRAEAAVIMERIITWEANP
ncbi:MAG: hypothetical protein E7390_01455 [Ruminococcaceae bacterium]|nr:hypothetical protein [Oscillospiraceae bacterium]